MKAGRALLGRIEEPLWVCGVLVASVLAWQAAVRLFGIQSFILPAPTAIFDEFMSDPAFFAVATWYTLMTTLMGFALAVLLGMLVAVGVVYSKFVERTVYTLMVTMNAVPKVALAPLFAVWMGIGAAPKIAIALTIAIFAIVINLVQGLRSVDADLLALARASRAPGWQVLLKIRLPAALPSLFSGMKIGISMALVGAIVGEFVAGNNGLGQAILVAQGNFQTPRMFVAIVILGVLGVVLFYLLEALERLCMPWHVSHRAKRRA